MNVAPNIPLSFTDNAAPANSSVTYQVIAYIPTPINSTTGSAVTAELPHPSNPVTIVTPAQPLWGWVDLHTHLMSNLAFGGLVFHGGVDVGSELPAVQMPSDPQCRFKASAASVAEALSDDAPTFGDAIEVEMRQLHSDGPDRCPGAVQ